MKVIVSIIMLTMCSLVHAQDLETQANDAYQAQDWATANAAYAELSADAPSNPRYLYRLAVTQRRLQEYDEALANYAAAAAAGVPAQFVDLEVARLYAAMGDDEKALASLQSTAKNGYGNAQALEDDPELSGLAALEGFPAILDMVKRNAAPCEYADEMRQFDFWVGEWEVFDEAETVKYGENSISKRAGGCYLQESWTSAGGVPGSSMNYYDPGQERWRQHWVGAGGSIIDIYGGIVDGSMVLEGRLYTVAPPAEKPFRGTWTPMPDGRVRQYFEQSDDGGETWVSWFEGFYKRKTE